jgi:hypothetical protein
MQAAVQAIEGFSSCAPKPEIAMPKLVLGEDGKVLGMSPEDADRVISNLDRLEKALLSPPTEGATATETDTAEADAKEVGLCFVEKKML